MEAKYSRHTVKLKVNILEFLASCLLLVYEEVIILLLFTPLVLNVHISNSFQHLFFVSVETFPRMYWAYKHMIRGGP